MATKPSIKVPIPRRTVSVHLLEPDVLELSFRGRVSRGLERGVAVTDLPIRMIGSALSFVAAVPVDFVPTREQALARLDAHRRDE